MKILLDFLPLILFFVAFKWSGIFWATAVAMTASIVQIIYLKWQHQKLEVIHWVILSITTVSGGATLLLHNEIFFKWKPSILYWSLGTALLIGKIAQKDFIRSILPANVFMLPEKIWNRLTWAWIAFFAAMGILNWYIAFHYPTEVWVNFKVFGFLGLTFVFTIAQSLMIAKYLPQDSPEEKSS